MGKPIIKPKVWYMKDIYADYASKLLADHPEWWGKYERRIELRNCYIYSKENGRIIEKMSWFKWREVVERYYHKAKDAIIEGEILRLGSELGRIRAIRVERNFSSKPQVNWGETRTQNLKDENEKLIRIYYTDDDWCRIAWEKFGMVKNETSYKFSPAEKNTINNKGFKGEFSAANQKDQLLRYKYKFYPLIHKKQQVA